MAKKFVLKMNFKNEEGKQASLTIKNIKENLPKDDIDAAMDVIIASNIFSSAGGSLVSRVGAQIVETTTKHV